MPFAYKAISGRVKTLLQEQFPEAAIDTEKGVAGRVHVRLVCKCFNRRSEREKQQMVWTALRNHLDPADLEAISVVLPFGFDDLP